MKLIGAATVLGLAATSLAKPTDSANKPEASHFKKEFTRTVDAPILDSLVSRVRRSPYGNQVNYRCFVDCLNDNCEVKCTKNGATTRFRDTGVTIQVPQEMRMVDANFGDVIQEGYGQQSQDYGCDGGCDGGCEQQDYNGGCDGGCDGGCEAAQEQTDYGCDGGCDGGCAQEQSDYGGCDGGCDGGCEAAASDYGCDGGCDSGCDSGCDGGCDGGCEAAKGRRLESNYGSRR